MGALIEQGQHAQIATALGAIGDLERILARVALRSARPRDLVQLREALGALPGLRRAAAGPESPLLQDLVQSIGDHGEEHALLQRAIAESPPHYLREGGVIAAGYDAELDELRALGANTEQFLVDLEARERERSGQGRTRTGTAATRIC